MCHSKISQGDSPHKIHCLHCTHLFQCFFDLQAAAAPVDPDFLNSVLGGLPGVDTNDPKLQSAVQAIAKPKDDDKSRDSKDPKEEDSKK